MQFNFSFYVLKAKSFCGKQNIFKLYLAHSPKTQAIIARKSFCAVCREYKLRSHCKHPPGFQRSMRLYPCALQGSIRSQGCCYGSGNCIPVVPKVGCGSMLSIWWFRLALRLVQKTPPTANKQVRTGQNHGGKTRFVHGAPVKWNLIPLYKT